MKLRSVLSCLLLLGACCPVPLQGAPMAFRAVVVGVSPEVSALQLRTPGTPPISLVAPPGAMRSPNGDALPVTAVRVGDEVYVRGTVRNGQLQAELVQRLE